MYLRPSLLFFSMLDVLLRECRALPSLKEAGFSISPISNFENSWAASCAHSTTVALPVHTNDEADEGVIILTRSKDIANDQIREDCVTREWNNLRLLVVEGQRTPATAIERSRWTLLGPTSVCTMTGLASDVDFLTRCLQQLVENHRSIYDEATPSQSKFMPIFSLVRSLCRLVREETIHQGSRPYGVQSLLVGYDPSQGVSASVGLDIFSVDPSGSFRYWPRGTAIGRNALSVRNELTNVLDDVKHFSNAEEVLELALLSLIHEEPVASASDFEGVLVTRLGTTLHIAKVDPRQIADILQTMESRPNL